MHSLPTVTLWNLRFAAVREAEAAKYVLECADAGVGGWVITPNLDILRQSQRDPAIDRILQQADLLVADGMPLVWSSRIIGTPLPERVAGSNLLKLICQGAALKGQRVYLLGGAPGAAAHAAKVLQQLYVGLIIAGTYCPEVGFERDPLQMHEMETALTDGRPDIIFVGLGFPKQEKTIQHLRPTRPSAWWLGVGISFSFVAGGVKRAPLWMQKSGLEWLHRLTQEPLRLGRRYLVDGLPFAVRLLASALLQRVRGKLARNGAL